MVGGDPTAGAPSPQGAIRVLWTYERHQLQAAITERGQLLGDLYGRAVDALSERDLVDGLSDVLSEEGMLPLIAGSSPARPTREAE
jgi:hypothetical protein